MTLLQAMALSGAGFTPEEISIMQRALSAKVSNAPAIPVVTECPDVPAGASGATQGSDDASVDKSLTPELKGYIDSQFDGLYKYLQNQNIQQSQQPKQMTMEDVMAQIIPPPGKGTK